MFVLTNVFVGEGVDVEVLCRVFVGVINGGYVTMLVGVLVGCVVRVGLVVGESVAVGSTEGVADALIVLVGEGNTVITVTTQMRVGVIKGVLVLVGISVGVSLGT